MSHVHNVEMCSANETVVKNGQPFLPWPNVSDYYISGL